jgi:hypothetical protein
MSTFPTICACCGELFQARSVLAAYCHVNCRRRAGYYRRQERPIPQPRTAWTTPIRPAQEIQPELLPAAPDASALAPFAFEGRQLRVSTDEQGNPWFIAADVCAALAIANPRDALTRLDDDEKGVASTDTLGGRQSLSTVNEFGLYSLILGSRKPDAKRFKRWVTHEVLPAIRRTGRYEVPRPQPQLPQLPPSGPAILIRAKTEREAAQLWCDTLALAAAGAIRRTYSTLHRGPDTLSLPPCAHWQHLPA